MTPGRVGRLVILADDLTGALDSACEFASETAPIAVGWSGRPPRGARIAYSTESRDVSAAQAVASVRRAARFIHRGDALCFKKIDSVLRGHPADELAAWFAMGGFDGAVLAPAFPDQGRRTVNGRQQRRLPDGTWVAVGPGLLAAMRSLGLTAARSLPADRPLGALPRRMVVVADAARQDHLDWHARRLTRRGGRRLLWCGTGGLAHALGGGGLAHAKPPVELIVAGTRHPVTRAQVERLTAAGVPSVVLRGQALRDPGRGRPIVLLADPDAPDARLAADRLRASLLSLRDWAPRPALITGGDTLRQFCDALGAVGLQCLGRLAPGIPVARLVRGAWPAATVVGKSGGFGDAHLLMELAAVPPNVGGRSS